MPLVAIPLSLIGVLFLLFLMGYSINLLTLLAMVLAIGLVVDDAIIVVENMQRHIDDGMTPLQASYRSARSVDRHHRHDADADRRISSALLHRRPDRRALREFAVTLAGAVFLSGVVALTFRR